MSEQEDQRRSGGQRSGTHRSDHEPPSSMVMLDACIPLFEVLKDRHRQAIFVQLVARGQMTVSEIAATSTLDRTTVSHHLKVLHQAGLVEVTKQGTRRWCRPRAAEVLDQLETLVGALRADLAAAASCRADPANLPGTDPAPQGVVEPR